MKKKFKLNVALKGFPAGMVLDLEVDKNKKPVDNHWSRRFEDAKIDGCIVAVAKESKEPKKKEEIEKQ